MNNNVGIQSRGLIAWNGAAAFPRKITGFTRFGFVFEVIAPLAANTIFAVEAAAPSAADVCVPGPFTRVLEVPICVAPIVPQPEARFIIPAGTAVGTICAGTIPCYPGTFIRLAAISGDIADVLAVLVLTGPMMN